MSIKSTFDSQFERIKLATGARTQVELAEILGVRQSAISDAKRRGTIPQSWLEALKRLKNVNPEWITHGHEPMYLPVFQRPAWRDKGCTRYCLEECPARKAIEQALRSIDCCPYICRDCTVKIEKKQE